MRSHLRFASSLCFALTVCIFAGQPATAIDLAYKINVPAYSVGFEHILTVDPAPPTLVDDGGDPAVVFKTNVWRPAPPSLGMLTADSSMSTDITAIGSGPTDEFHVFSPAGVGSYKLLGTLGLPGSFYDGENSAFTAEGIGPGPGTASKTIWDVEILSTGEPIGTPVKVDVAAIIQGYLEASGVTHGILPDAHASWHVAAEGIPAISGTATLLDGPGIVPFAEDNLASPITFYKVVGDTFTLEIDYKLEVDGEGFDKFSLAEVTGSEVLVFATVVPEPSTAMLALIALLGTAWLGRRSQASRA